jgi:hypothetical protein
MDNFKKAIDEFNSELFFECHDTLEEIWNEERDQELKKFYHGLIHITVAFYHLTNYNFRGAVSQFKKAIDKLSNFPEIYRDINLSELLTQVKIWLEKAENALKGNEQNFDFSNLPKIKFVDKQ